MIDPYKLEEFRGNWREFLFRPSEHPSLESFLRCLKNYCTKINELNWSKSAIYLDIPRKCFSDYYYSGIEETIEYLINELLSPPKPINLEDFL